MALGNSSNEVEQLITVPIENQLNGIEGLTDMRSKSVAQLSSIRLIFSRGTDELRARQLVTERLSQITATLPTWASPPFLMPALSATSRILKIGLRSDSMDLDRHVDDRVLEDPVRGCSGCRASPRSRSGANDYRNATCRSTRRSSSSTTSPCSRRWTRLPTPSRPACCRYSDGAVVGTGGFVESDGTRLQHPPRPADHRPRGARPGPGAGAGRQDRPAGRPRSSARRPRTADR